MNWGFLLGSVLAVTGTVGFARLLQALAETRGRTLSATKASLLGFACTVVVLVSAGVAIERYKTAQLSERILEDQHRKAEFLRQLCDELKAKGENPGAGC